MTIKDATTVGSHLSELQSSKRIILLSEHGKLNVFSKATPTISGYFSQQEVGSLYSLYGSWRHRITRDKIGFVTKVNREPLQDA